MGYLGVRWKFLGDRVFLFFLQMLSSFLQMQSVYPGIPLNIMKYDIFFEVLKLCE